MDGGRILSVHIPLTVALLVLIDGQVRSSVFDFYLSFGVGSRSPVSESGVRFRGAGGLGLEPLDACGAWDRSGAAA